MWEEGLVCGGRGQGPDPTVGCMCVGMRERAVGAGRDE